MIKQKMNIEQRGIMALLLFLLTAKVFGQNGSEYPINDPRNPNCPCHKHQEQAEAEYRNMLNREAEQAQAGNRPQQKIIHQGHVSNIPNRQNRTFNTSRSMEGNDVLQSIDLSGRNILALSVRPSLQETELKLPQRLQTKEKRPVLKQRTHQRKHKRKHRFNRMKRFWENKCKSRLREAKQVALCYHWN